MPSMNLIPVTAVIIGGWQKGVCHQTISVSAVYAGLDALLATFKSEMDVSMALASVTNIAGIADEILGKGKAEPKTGLCKLLVITLERR